LIKEWEASGYTLEEAEEKLAADGKTVDEYCEELKAEMAYTEAFDYEVNDGMLTLGDDEVEYTLEGKKLSFEFDGLEYNLTRK
ncbi:MAG: hypothetical protein IKV35_04030, partial [Clostridia bacterium]|nr:hypothetical protein [Clostridia bacterium]